MGGGNRMEVIMIHSYSYSYYVHLLIITCRQLRIHDADAQDPKRFAAVLADDKKRRKYILDADVEVHRIPKEDELDRRRLR